MSKSKKTALIKYGVGFAVCGLCTAAMIFSNDLAALSAADRYRVLCDAFFVPGIMSILIGLLFWVSNEGAFLGVGYLASNLVKALLPGGRNRMESYGDYRERKTGKRVSGYGFLFVIGGLFLAVSMVLLVLFYQNFQ